MKIVLVCGARPNFMKIAPLLRAMAKYNSRTEPNKPNELNKPNRLFAPLLVHTGQHYDFQMSQVFFRDLELPEPDIYLGVGSGTHAEQTAKVMVEFEKLLLEHRPDLVLVVGDVNSTIAAALAAVKVHIPVAHVEAGLRSGDRTMPEEINRLLTDQISDYLFTPSPDADENLKKEGVAGKKIFFVGNVMIDSLLYNKPLAEKSDILERLGLLTQQTQQTQGTQGTHSSVTPYALLTLHRPANVDDKQALAGIMSAITAISERIPVVFPAHPRTLKKLEEFNISPPSAVVVSPDELNEPNKLNKLNEPKEPKELLLTPPLSYVDFLKLEMYARLVMTDSGGIQEETTVLNVPCLTLRENTERPITITQGTNVLVGTSPERIVEEAFRILSCESGSHPHSLNKPYKPNEPNKLKEQLLPPLWDGRTAERIVEVLARIG